MFDVSQRVALLLAIETLQGVNAELGNTAECYSHTLDGTASEGLFHAAGALLELLALMPHNDAPPAPSDEPVAPVAPEERAAPTLKRRGRKPGTRIAKRADAPAENVMGAAARCPVAPVAPAQRNKRPATKPKPGGSDLTAAVKTILQDAGRALTREEIRPKVQAMCPDIPARSVLIGLGPVLARTGWVRKIEENGVRLYEIDRSQL